MLRDNAQRAKTTIILFWILFGVTVISMISTYIHYNFLKEALTGGKTYDELVANDRRQAMIATVELIVQVILIVNFIMWFRRAYYNLHSLNCYLRFSEGWAAGAWFVPFLNLVRPYQIMKEIWDRTQERTQEGIENPRIESSTIIGIWWALWLITGIAANIYIRIVWSGDQDIQNLMALDKFAIILDGANLVNTLIIIAIVRKISGFEEKLKDVIAIENIAPQQNDSTLVS